jgi:hypothetical protein
MSLSKLDAVVWVLLAAGLALAVCSALAAPVERPKSPAEKAGPIPPFNGKMVTRGQKATPDGSKVVLYSRNRHGNYPVASYSFGRGLRGDDETVENLVDLVFGNRQREDAFSGAPIDSVPGVGGAGACGMDGGNAGEPGYDEFRVGLYGGCRHRISDLGEVDYARADIPADLAILPDKGASSAEQAKVVPGHVYIVHAWYPDGDRPFDIYVKLKVLRHRDNDAVEFEWAKLATPKRK